MRARMTTLKRTRTIVAQLRLKGVGSWSEMERRRNTGAKHEHRKDEEWKKGEKSGMN